MSPLIPYKNTTPAKFKKFMSTYKPFFIEEVSLETIQRLQAWVDEIQAILEANRERYEPLVTPKDNGIFITVSPDQIPKD
jgi:hypothetical protein